MIDFSSAHIEELEILNLCLTNTRRDCADLDLPLLEEIINQVTAELEKRS